MIYQRLFNIFVFIAGGLAVTGLGIALVAVKQPQTDLTLVLIGIVVQVVALVPLYGLMREQEIERTKP